MFTLNDGFELKGCARLTLVLMGGGGWFYPALKNIIFTAKTRYFKGCLRVWSRGHQVLGHHCKQGKLAISHHAKRTKK